ncbi:MAG: hypothetical protein Q8904_16095 [Bacteroidota bacterium]|nr:hypothetical protein [Bacteroidota bacterium]
MIKHPRQFYNRTAIHPVATDRFVVNIPDDGIAKQVHERMPDPDAVGCATGIDRICFLFRSPSLLYSFLV